MTQEQIISTIKKWFEINRPDYFVDNRLTDEFLKEVYDFIVPDLKGLEDESECLFVISSELDFSFDVEIYKILYKEIFSIFNLNFPEEYESLKKGDELDRVINEITLSLERKGIVMSAIIYDSINDNIEVEEEKLEELIFNEIKNYLKI